MTTFEEQLKEALSNAYDIERELGGGGMSRVFVATERSLGRKVVIKLLSPELTAEVNRGRFRREIQVAAQLQHPHIVTLLSAGEHGDLVYYTMPFIKGESLKSALEKDGALGVPEVVRVLYDVVDALSYAHENGVVHRDIKPANILRSGSHFLVTDFGVAKALNAAMQSGQMTSTGMAIGTPAYMSPEQLAGDPAADHRIDIYAVGLLAYELLAGRSPFAAPTPKGVLAAVLTREPQPLVEVRPDVPASLSELVMSCLSKEPEERPETAFELLANLDMFSTASGEIRTREHRVHKTPGSAASAFIPSTPTGNPAFSGSTGAVTADSFGASREQPSPVVQSTSPDQPLTYEPPGRERSQRNRKLIGAVAFLIPVLAGAILVSKLTGGNAVTDAAVPASAAIADSTAADSATADSAAQSQLPGAVDQSPVAVVTIDSQAIADSARKKAQASKRAAAMAKADSLRAQEAQENKIILARRAVGALLANADARAAFMRGATRSGGLLGTRRKGDLQTQIDALQPFLRNADMTYDEFKRIVQRSGSNIFDEYGRMMLEAMQTFAAAN
jgi:serine/threonine-protein kinase